MKAANEAGTEERIKEAARQVFLEKGFAGTTMRDIAGVAKINCALTNYYFRSKEKLFWLVFEEMLKQYQHQMLNVLNNTRSLREKITELVEDMYRFNADNPKLSLFVMNEIRRDPKRFLLKTGIHDLPNTVFQRQLDEGIRRNEIRPISSYHLLGIINSSISQLFASKDLHMVMFQTAEGSFEKYAEEHKRITLEMILGYLFIS